MQTQLILTALIMGVVGGPHCAVMCGSSCVAFGRAHRQRINISKPHTSVINPQNQGILLFHLGRLVGYSGMGAVAATSVQLLGWLSIHSAALRPIWSMIHVIAIVLGLLLLTRGQQPLWLDLGTKRLWQRFQSWRFASHAATPFFVGAAWAFMPCGLLYSALLVAALTGQTVDGIISMMMFALGSSLSLFFARLLWLRVKSFTHAGQWATRSAGLLLAISSSWGLWMALAKNAAPWCIS
jgi:uncharacterized protein